MSFSGKVVFVSGGSSGIGAATAREFAKEGATVVIVARNETKMKQVASECENHGKRPLLITADISQDAEAKRAMEATIQTYGKLDILVNNAGMLRYGTLLDGGALAAWDQVMAINFRAALHLMQLAAPHLVETRGSIVNVSSVDGSSSVPPPLVPYSVSKAALEHLTRGAARELAPHGVRVNTVSPGPVYTDIYDSGGPHPVDNSNIKTPLGTISQPEEIAHLILFLCSDRAKAITGSNYVSDNGYLLLPV
ncbi:3-oxoacyl-[acyl-carrier-protein] reductase FabG [Papilio machaon]|uniref:3-oxoacyl-[acyl-carrier-protein] reductase FabG n=1 Tax=Papilio machaon TaxID=76193 RepID=A0A0N0PET2_PAPMA|nr:3-oxoacyl-[acyl-carrier-protein] reductase FabG [Papilio machaon]